MNTREQFGKYILLKKLAEDPLGETFRAGKLSEQGIEQVVLLRVFNGQGLESNRLWQRVADRGVLQEGLKSPNLGNGVDFGEIQGVPFTAYDYISGASLATLMEQAESQRSPVPLDHALLISERIALGLAAAYETRLGDERVLHGFVTPGLVMISNEGEARLLGLEIAPGLREQSGSSSAARTFARYLSPETLAGQPPERSDDVYSLGAILFELLTGKQVPSGQGGDLSGVISQIKTSSEGEAVPESILQLLQQSLVARGRRISDVANWHKRLSQLMIEGQFNPTTFNLAFFMHSLFRDEIERESREMQTEQRLDAPALTMEIPTDQVSEVMIAAGVNETVMMRDVVVAEDAPVEKRKKSWLPLAAILLLVIAASAVGYFAYLKRGAQTADAADSAASQPAPPPLPGPTSEEIQGELDRIRQEMQDAMEVQKEQLAEQYEERLSTLQSKAAQAQRDLEERKRLESEAEQRAKDERKEQEAAEAAKVAQAQADKKAEEEKKAAELAAAAPPPTVPGTTVGEVIEAKPKPAVSTPPPPKAQSTPVTAPPPTKEPAVKVGDLVTPGPGVVQPKKTRCPQPRYTEPAKRAGRTGTVKIRVLVDEKGKVVETKLEGRKLGFGLDQSALQAARQCSFRAATKNGIRVKMWTQIQFAYTL